MYRIVRIPETESTNTHLKTLAAEGERDLCIIADRQTGGRGRLGRTFESPDGGLYMSFVRRAGELDGNAVTARAAVAAARAIERLTGLDVRIKWVNDLYVGRRKLAGILCEGVWDSSAGKPEYLIVGIGVNLADGLLSEELRYIATSVEAEGGRIPDRTALAEEILREFEECTEFLEEYRRRQLFLGCVVTVHRGNERFIAIAKEIDDNCAMILRLNDGSRITLNSGEISLRLV